MLPLRFGVKSIIRGGVVEVIAGWVGGGSFSLENLAVRSELGRGGGRGGNMPLMLFAAEW